MENLIGAPSYLGVSSSAVDAAACSDNGPCRARWQFFAGEKHEWSLPARSTSGPRAEAVAVEGHQWRWRRPSGLRRQRAKSHGQVFLRTKHEWLRRRGSCSTKRVRAPPGCVLSWSVPEQAQRRSRCVSSSAVHPGMEYAGCSPCGVLDASAAWGDAGGVF